MVEHLYAIGESAHEQGTGKRCEPLALNSRQLVNRVLWSSDLWSTGLHCCGRSPLVIDRQVVGDHRTGTRANCLSVQKLCHEPLRSRRPADSSSRKRLDQPLRFRLARNSRCRFHLMHELVPPYDAVSCCRLGIDRCVGDRASNGWSVNSSYRFTQTAFRMITP